MKATVYTKYGPPEVLRLTEVERPVPGANEVLVRVHASSVNYSDWCFVRGKPFAVRLAGMGLLRPKNKILGADISGQVEAIGEQVKQFQPGDEVYGDLAAYGWGGFAEYAAVAEEALALKPANLTLTESAAVPQAGVVALQSLRDTGEIQPGCRVLIHGASGGIGTFAVQIAGSFGAEVVGVCSAQNEGLLRALGAAQVIDYTQEDFTRSGSRYDLILDIAARHPLSDIKRALSPRGRYVIVGGSLPRIIQAGLKRGDTVSNFDLQQNQEDLVLVTELIESGQVIPVIDRRYPLCEVAEAVRYYGERHSRGKVIITVADPCKRD